LFAISRIDLYGLENQVKKHCNGFIILSIVKLKQIFDEVNTLPIEIILFEDFIELFDVILLLEHALDEVVDLIVLTVSGVASKD